MSEREIYVDDGAGGSEAGRERARLDRDRGLTGEPRTVYAYNGTIRDTTGTVALFQNIGGHNVLVGVRRGNEFILGVDPYEQTRQSIEQRLAAHPITMAQIDTLRETNPGIVNGLDVYDVQIQSPTERIEIDYVTPPTGRGGR